MNRKTVGTVREKERERELHFKSLKGITLIALAVTLVILLIITGITLNFALGENGLIKSAQNAKELAEIDDETSTIKRASLAALIRTKANDISKDELDKSLEGEFGSKASYTLDEDEDLYIVNITKSKRSYLVDKEGNVSSRGKWGADYTTGRISINGEEVKSGNVYLEIGDTIAGYDPTNGATYNEVISYGESTPEHPSANGYADTVFRLKPGDAQDEQTVSYDLSKGWKLLGVTSSGNLMITTADKVTPAGGGYKSGNTYFYRLIGRIGYKYAVEELDKICKLYGQGKYAINSRSIKIEDVNKITRYNPEDIDGNGTPYNEGKISEYGNEILYSWKADSAGYPYYSYGEGENSVEAKLTISHDNGFYYFDSITEDWKGPIAKTAIGDITSLTNTYYTYQRAEAKCSTKAKALVFLNMSYVVASRMIWCRTDWIVFGLSVVGAQVVDEASVSYSKGYDGANNLVVRPVVILDNNINIAYQNGVWTVSSEE